MKNKKDISKLTLMILYGLKIRTSTGYDLQKLFSTLVRQSPSHQQVYRELRRMSEQQLIGYRVIPSDSKPDSKLYRISKQGRDLLELTLEAKTNPYIATLAPLLHFKAESVYLSKICELIKQDLSLFDEELDNPNLSTNQVLHIREKIIITRSQLEILELYRDDLARVEAPVQAA
ncbi:PadR family transcriptional regulator [Vibrio agarivorans]|uniref:PadR family transcriptional regulator n=1 Tax=Vibrio agarivorans TaxID=153622 RepID=UPI0025B4248F|nr:PadR family transcriptional regulator [Vibrio agarivorans]MDN3661139.1 PadR family transcriptional regulator [Vibrio agarivorans]